jgi:hypothetical protein
MRPRAAMSCQIDGPHGGLPLFWPWCGQALPAPLPLPPSRALWRLAPPSLQVTLDPLKAVSPLASLVYRQLYSLHHAPSVWPLLHTIFYHCYRAARAPSTC